MRWFDSNRLVQMSVFVLNRHEPLSKGTGATEEYKNFVAKKLQGTCRPMQQPLHEKSEETERVFILRKETEIMTDVELDALKKRMRDNLTLSENERDRIRNELWCVEMINSIIAYSYSSGFPPNFTGEDLVKNEESKKYSYLSEYIKSLGRSTVVKLADGQICDVSAVRSNVFTDDEGVTYNSIVWKR